MTQRPKKRTSAKGPTPTNQGNISIGGNVSGTGNVVGHGSSSNVKIPDSGAGGTSSKQRSSAQKKSAQNRLLWIRLIAFLLALAGTLAAILTFVRLLQAVEVWAVVQLVLVAIVAALGISGTIKPQAIVDLLAKIQGKG